MLYSISSFIFENFESNINYLHTSTESDIRIAIVYIYIYNRIAQVSVFRLDTSHSVDYVITCAACGLFAPSPPPTIPPQFHLDILFGIGLGNMVFGLCRGAWPYKGPCTAGGKLAAEALRVLKKSIQHAGARRRGWGAAPLSQLRRALALAWWEKGAGHKTKTERGQVRQVAWLLPTLNGS